MTKNDPVTWTWPQPMPVDLFDDGLLWLINATVFHPRGFALALDKATGDFYLDGDGKEPWSFSDAVADDKFKAAQRAFKRARKARR